MPALARHRSQVLLAACLLVAGLAAGHRPILGHAAARGAGQAGRSGLVALLIAIAIAFAALVAYARARRRLEKVLAAGGEPEPAWRGALRSALSVLVVALACAGALAIANLRGHPPHPESVGHGHAHTRPSRLRPGPSPPSGDHRASLALAFALLAAAAAAGGVTLWRRRLGKPAPTAADADAPVSAAADAGLVAIGAPADAREAVLAAYAAMERALAQHGLPRLRAEAPREYLGRAFARLPAAAGPPGRELTALFEDARFGTAPVDAAARGRAEAALVRLVEVTRP